MNKKIILLLSKDFHIYLFSRNFYLCGEGKLGKLHCTIANDLYCLGYVHVYLAESLLLIFLGKVNFRVTPCKDLFMVGYMGMCWNCRNLSLVIL